MADPARPEIDALYRDPKLQVDYVPLSSLAVYRRNARTHSKRQIAQIAESMRAFGIVSPLVIDAHGELIAGHGRLAAAQQLGYTALPVIRIDHLDDAQKRALRIADNRLAELAGWDETLLALEFKDLLTLDLTLDLSFDLAVTGFASAEVDRLVETTAKPSDAADEIAPEIDRTAPPVSRLGDLWMLGEHRIICGDARDAQLYATLLAGEPAGMGIHDVPYNVSVTQHVSRSGKHAEFVMGVGELTEAEFTAFIAAFLQHATAHSRLGAVQYAFIDWRHIGEMLAAGRAAGLAFKNLAVWNKGVGAMGSLLRSQHELVFVFQEPSAPVVNNVQLGRFGRNRTNVWDYPGAAGLRRELELHPTPKPVALVADAIRDVSRRNEIVLDCFSGSGTTIIAAAKTGRRARVIELDPHYVDVAVARWQSWSGEVARLAESDLSFAEVAAMRCAEASSPVADGSGLPSPVRVRQRPQAA